MMTRTAPDQAKIPTDPPQLSRGAERVGGRAKIAERLQADAPDMRRPGADLIAHYLDPDRLPVRDRWPRQHADT